jgi:uncharacterized membrane protein
MAETAWGKSTDTSRNLAMVSYGLLFAAIFFAGVPALIAAIIAYTQRDEATPEVRTHYDFQIRIFWIAFAMSIAAGACLLGAVVSGVADLVTYHRLDSFLGEQDVHIDLSRISIDGRIIVLTVTGIVLMFLTALWLVSAPAIGFIRLASSKMIGHSPAP